MKLAGFALAVFVALAAGCARSERAPSPVACGSSAPVVDDTLLAFLSKARALHHRADIAEVDDKPGDAIAALEQIVSTPAPDAPEADEVLADTRARLAELRAKGGDFDRARADVDAGLAKAKTDGYFRGHLYEVLGLVEEKRAAALAKAGDAKGADAAKKKAIEASEQAVRIQDGVIKKALEEKK